MDVVLLFFVWSDQVNSRAPKNVLIETTLHRKSCSQQRHAFNSDTVRFVAGRFDDAYQRNPGTALQFVENDVRGVCRECAEVCARLCQPLDLDDQVVSKG